VNLPNAITLARLGLTGVFILAVSLAGPTWAGIALVTFVVAAATDWLDGFLARKMNLVTSLGKLLDPIADKVLVASAFVYLTQRGFCPVWITCVILTREFLVTGLRQIAVEKGHVMAADWSGKWKTTFQLTFCIAALLWIYLVEMGGDTTGWFAKLVSPDGWVQPLTLWVSLALTAISGVQYTWRARGILKG
jgi:CDP-diacylglycerol--glycerol-3-phosphate 3-phosphatidyltransferase